MQPQPHSHTQPPLQSHDHPHLHPLQPNNSQIQQPATHVVPGHPQMQIEEVQNSQENAVKRRKNVKLRAARRKQLIEGYRARASTEMVVAALITTVALTVGFTMPGGYNDDGEALLRKKKAFRVCFIANTAALLASTSALTLYVMTPVIEYPAILHRCITWARNLTLVSVVAMILAYSSGTHAVQHGKFGSGVYIITLTYVVILACSLVVAYSRKLRKLASSLLHWITHSMEKPQ